MSGHPRKFTLPSFVIPARKTPQPINRSDSASLKARDSDLILKPKALTLSVKSSQEIPSSIIPGTNTFKPINRSDSTVSEDLLEPVSRAEEDSIELTTLKSADGDLMDFDEDFVEKDNLFCQPKWEDMSLERVYNILNPIDKDELKYHKDITSFAKNIKGKNIRSLRDIGNQLLKEMVQFNLMNGDGSNILIKKKKGRKEQMENFIGDASADRYAFVANFLYKNITFVRSSSNPDQCINHNDLTVNLGCRVIMLTVESETLQIMDEIFSGGLKNERRIRMEDSNASFDSMWRDIANIFNAHDFNPENRFVEVDERLTNCDPSTPPNPAWDAATLRDWFTKFRTYFARVSVHFRGTGKYDTFPGSGEGDKFLESVKSVLDECNSEIHIILLFAYYAWNGYLPELMSREKPAHLKFDSSIRNTNGQVQKRLKTDDGLGLALMESSKLSDTEVQFYQSNADKCNVEKDMLDAQKKLYIAQAHAQDVTNKEIQLEKLKRFIDNPVNNDSPYLQQAKDKMEKLEMELLLGA